MNTPDPMPSNFGLKYIFWMTCRWVYFNPLTIFMTVQGILFQLALDNPTIHWLGTGASVIGVAIAQVRNKGKDYTVPVADTKRAQAIATLTTTPSTPVKPATPETSK